MILRPLRILLAHNFYRSSAPSGENTVFENERRLLEESGVEVVPFIRTNDSLDDRGLRRKLSIAIETSWSRQSYRDLQGLIHRYRPDVAHFHNTFPQISPSGYAACQALGVPVIQTLHNFRLICAGAMLQRKGLPCEDCVGTTLLPGLRHRCYRGSISATGAITLMLAMNRLSGAYARNVDRYIALTSFAASRFKAGGLPADRIVVKPNFLYGPPPVGDGAGGYAVYVGRLSAEKGVVTLLKAWQTPGLPRLRILGDGPLRGEIERLIKAGGLRVEVLGFCSKSEVLRNVGHALFQVVPSECYEGFPMVILEALALGTPVIASRIGSLDEIVEEDVTGAKFTACDAVSLVDTIQRVLRKPMAITDMRAQVRRAFDTRYTPASNLRQLLGIYKSVLPQNSAAYVGP